MGSILLVDDDSSNLYAMESLMEHLPLKVIAVSDGLEAYNVLQKTNSIKLILMDMMMPGMDGFETIKKVRDHNAYKDIPIIALTARAMALDKEKCINAGANDYLSKPIDIDALMCKIKSYTRI